MSASKRQSTREIERKFLIKRYPDGLRKFPHHTIAQGYLAVGPGGLQVRLRKKGAVRSLTFKQGTKGTREEREIRLSVEQFDALWPATVGRRLTKVRYEVPWKAHTIKIDIYRGGTKAWSWLRWNLSQKAARPSSARIGLGAMSPAGQNTATSRWP